MNNIQDDDMANQAPADEVVADEAVATNVNDYAQPEVDEEELARGMAGDQDTTSEGQNQRKLYVGNLSYDVRTEDLRELFGQVGELIDVVVVMDRFKQDWSKGFGFVEYTNNEAAAAAVAKFNN